MLKPGPAWLWYWMVICGYLSLMFLVILPNETGRPIPAISFKQISSAPASMSLYAKLV